MNSRFEINKRKEYQNGLSAAFSVSLPDDFRSDLEELMADKEAVEHELDEKYQTLREEYQQEQAQIVSLEEARKNKPKYEE